MWMADLHGGGFQRRSFAKSVLVHVCSSRAWRRYNDIAVCVGCPPTSRTFARSLTSGANYDTNCFLCLFVSVRVFVCVYLLFCLFLFCCRDKTLSEVTKDETNVFKRAPRESVVGCTLEFSQGRHLRLSSSYSLMSCSVATLSPQLPSTRPPVSSPRSRIRGRGLPSP